MANGPSFLLAIAEVLSTQRQAAVENMMDEARRLLGEAFAALELAETGLGSVSSDGARRSPARGRMGRAASVFDADGSAMPFGGPRAETIVSEGGGRRSGEGHTLLGAGATFRER